MLRVKINGTIIDLPKDIAIQVKAANPIFSENGFNETYSYSFTIQKTARNKSIIHRLPNRYFNITIEFGSYLIESGIGNVKTNFNSFSISFKNNAIDLRQRLEETNLKSLDLGTVQVCEESDLPTVKIQKWVDHMTQTTITDPVTSGSHKFPHIQADDEAQDQDYFDEWYQKNPDYIFSVNALQGNQYVKNVGWPVAYNGSQPAWWNSVSPCLRIEFIFNKLMEKITKDLGITLNENQLDQIIEFKQMIHFSLLTMDKIEENSGFNYNVHGTSFELTKFAPKLNGMDLFKMLDEIFGIYSVLKNGKLKILLKKNLVNSRYIDVSKYCQYEYEIEEREYDSVQILYPIDLDLLGLVPTWDTYVTTISGDLTTRDHDDITIGNGNSQSIEYSYIPMKSYLSYSYPEYPSTWNGSVVYNSSMHTYFKSVFGLISKHYSESEWNNSGGIEKFLIGLIRGKHDLYNQSTSSFDEKMVFSNQHKFNDQTLYYELVTYTFGTCSLYLNSEKSHIDVYVKKFIDLMRRADLITKLLYMPIHKIVEIMKWEEPNHIIKQRNLSFKGMVKEINFTLYLDRVSPVSVTYAVSRPEAGGDFNQDYNEDLAI